MRITGLVLLLILCCHGKDVFRSFDIWLKEVGVFRDNRLEVRNAGPDRGRGIFTTESIPSDTVILRIPSDAMLIPRFKETVLVQGIGNFSATEEAALFLMYVKHAKKFDKLQYMKWYAYIDTLPKTFSTPLFWSEKDLKELGPSHVLPMVQRRQKAIDVRYQEVFLDADKGLFKNFSAAFPQEVMTKEEFRWSLSILWSRVFAVLIDDKEERGLVPFADLFNSPVRASDVSQLNVSMSDNVLEYRTNRDVEAGEELLVPYGRGTGKDNTQLLMDYGFRRDEISPLHEYAMLNVEKFYEGISDVAFGVIQSNGIYLKEFPVWYNRFPHRVLQFFRVLSSTKEELSIKERVQLCFNESQPISNKSEQVALQKMAEALRARLNEYESFSAASGDESFISKMAHLQVESEKMCLVRALDAVKRMIDILNQAMSEKGHGDEL